MMINASALRELEKRVIDRIDTRFEEQKRHEEEMFSNLNREQEQQVHYDDDDADEELILDTDTNDLVSSFRTTKFAFYPMGEVWYVYLQIVRNVLLQRLSIVIWKSVVVDLF